MIRPKLQRVANGTRLTTDLINAIINRTEYASDLLRQYKLIAGNRMYVEPHYDGTRVSYYYPVGGGATPKGAPITVPLSSDIEIQPGVVYTILSEGGTIPPFKEDGTPTIFTFAQIAYSLGMFITGGLWEYLSISDGKWKGLLDGGYISPFNLSFYSGFRATPGKDSFGTRYWSGGTIQIGLP